MNEFSSRVYEKKTTKKEDVRWAATIVVAVVCTIAAIMKGHIAFGVFLALVSAALLSFWSYLLCAVSFLYAEHLDETRIALIQTSSKGTLTDVFDKTTYTVLTGPKKITIFDDETELDLSFLKRGEAQRLALYMEETHEAENIFA